MRQRAWLLFWLLVGVMGCQEEAALPPTPLLLNTATPALLDTPTPFVPVAPPETTAVAQDSGWQLLQPGIEQRQIEMVGADGRFIDELLIVRVQPDAVRVEVAYSPGAPKSLLQWQQETGALMVVNGGFFTPEFVATGLVVVDGQPSGVSYGEFAGMLAVTEAGAEVRWLGERPYSADEPLQYALQSFPMLVKPGGVRGYSEEDGETARRTAVGMDGNGRLLFIFAPLGGFTLAALSDWLVASDLGLDVALNLDGGTSTGLVLDGEMVVLGFTAVPTVIVVYKRP